MWICDNCGQPLDDNAKKCTMCGMERIRVSSKKAEEAQASRIFEFGTQKKEPEKTKPEAIPDEITPTEPSVGFKDERRIITILNRLMRTPEFWLIFGAIILGFLVIPWSIQQIIKITFKPADNNIASVVEPELREKFELIIDDALPDKLEWAREVMRRRIPTRFPEELTMDINKQDAEVKYDNKEKTSAYYRLLISYHFIDANKKTYFWQPVTFYFEVRDGVWTLIGDHWIRESELELE